MSLYRTISYLRRRAARAQADTLVPYEVDPAAYWREEDRKRWEKQASYSQKARAEAAAASTDQPLPPHELTSHELVSYEGAPQAQGDARAVEPIVPPSPPIATSGGPVVASQPANAAPVPDPPSMVQILEDISALVRQYLFCSADQLTVLTLWVVHTYGFEYFPVTPYLNISSPENQSGKTVCMQLLHLLCRNPWMPSGVTPSRLISRITQSQPTLLLDNCNTLFRASGGLPADGQPIVGFLNAGFAHGYRFVTRDDDRESYKSIFCPKAFAGQGSLPASLAARCIPIVLQRRKPTESALPFWPDIVFQEAFRLVGPIPAWLKENAGPLREAAFGFLCNPWPELSRHQDDAMPPLLAIGKVAGGKWRRKALYALSRILRAQLPGPRSVGVQLLSDIWDFFSDLDDPPKIHTAPLLDYLNRLDDRPWTKKKLTPEGLRCVLRNFAVPRSRNQLIGNQYLKGFTFNHFARAWESYLAQGESRQEAASLNTDDPPLVATGSELVQNAL